MQQDGQETMPEGEHEEEKQLDQLKHIVSRTLEAKGVLGTIRAQLRAAVFTALDEQERANGVYLENYRVQKIKSSPESKLLLALMHEFFEFYELDRTLSVFMPEATWTQAEYPGRQQLSRDLGFASTSTRHGNPTLEGVERQRVPGLQMYHRDLRQSPRLHGKKPHDSNPVMMANLANASLPEAVTREIASAKSRVLPEAFGEATSPNLARGRKSLSSPHSGRSDIEEEQKEYKVPGKDIWDGSLSSPSACNEIGNQSVSNDGSMPAVDQMHSTASLSASASYDKEDDAASEQSQTAQSLTARDQNSPDAASPGLASLKTASDVDDFEVDSEVSDNNGLMGLDTEENDVGDFDDESHSSKKEDSQSVALLSPVRTQAAAAPVPPLATQGFDASFDSDGEDFGVSLGASNVATDQATLSEEQTKQSARRSEALSFEDEKPSASPEGFNSDFDSEDETFGVTFAPKEPTSRRVEASENANEEDSDAGEESVAEHSMTEASVDHLHDIAKGQMNSEDEGEDEEDSASDAEDAGDEVDGIASDEDNDSENSRSHDGLFSASHEESNDFDVANQGREDARASEDDEDDDEDRGLEKNQASDIVQDEDSMSHEDSMSLGNSHSISQNEQSSEFGIDDQDKEQEDALMNQDEEEVLGNDVSEIDEYAHDDQEMSHGDSHSISQHDESSEFSMADQNKEQEDALMAQEEEEDLGNDVSDIDEHAQDDQDVANGESHSFSQDDESSESSMADQDKGQEDASMDQEKEEDFGNEVSKIEGDTRNDTSAGLAGAGSSSLVESAGLMSPVESPPRQGITSPNEDEQSGFSFDASFNSDEDVGINLSGAPSTAKTGASTQMGSEELNEENVGLLGRKGEVEMDELDNSGEGDDAEDGHDVKSDDEDALDNLSTSEDIVVENDDHSELEDVFGEKSHDLSGDEDNEKDFGDDGEGEGEDEDEDEDEEDYGEDFEEDFEEGSGGEEEDEAQGDDLDLDGDEQMSIPSEVESVSSVESALSAKSGTSDLVSVEHDDAPTAHIKIDLDEQIVETVEHGVDDHTLESACDDVFG
ncbi:FGFR1 onco partner [Hondaea fermentalgiana]|uniref:Centrosomal protein 43 n=1 Tax=Hondaea fermentalgiana TaxID=2315210 RepID=A0A2R5GRB5_9STRA|nr:FGFR1 onco partner [Hondaea fermentalgiana]|eukprot:GBG33422.1 FGFR1 onco partner [Hondaea fermentalgiana]